MKTSPKVFLVLGLMAVFALAIHAQTAVKKVETVNIQQPPIGRIYQPCPAPDLAASRPTIVKSIVGGRAYLNLTAKVTNIGGKDFISRPDQASARLIVKQYWLSGPAQYATIQAVPIARLNKGQAINLSGSYLVPNFQKWNCTTPLSPGECCRELEVIVMVSYDPDILMDGNIDNDDCNYNNNRCANVPANHVKYTVECPW